MASLKKKQMANFGFDPPAGSGRTARNAFRQQLDRTYAWYGAGLIAFIVLLALLERLGLPKPWIGMTFLAATILLYAGIGLMSRTHDAVEYYVAGRRVPAVYNGMATGADWMSAASFIGLAGTLYLQGYGGLAFVMGWTGGYCLVALLLAPYLRKFGQFTIPDFIGARFGGSPARALAIAAAILCSFIYLVAQIYGVGLIAARLTQVNFGVGIFLGLGGILLCSFLGGMRAVTWTQVAQYIVLVVAYLVPVVWLSYQQTGNPIAQWSYGAQLAEVTRIEGKLRTDPKELEVIAVFKARAAAAEAKLKNVAAAMAEDRAAAQQKLDDLVASNGPVKLMQQARKTLAALPRTVEEARRRYTEDQAGDSARAAPLGGMPAHAAVFAGDPAGDAQARQTFDHSRRNFLALVFCLMAGTAALPHILVRYYTTPSVKQARESVTWSLLFIFLLYFTAPALAVLVKYEIFHGLVGTPFDQLPAWIANWQKVDPSLLSVADVNGDGIFQLGEMRIGSDIVMLATPEIAGLPYVISGMVAAGGLAAALSTADGLLLTIANALSHDLYYKMIDPNAPTSRRVAISKALLLVVAMMAAYAAYTVYLTKQVDIVFLVSVAFSLAASAFFPALVLGIFWRRASSAGAVCGIAAGLGLAIYYMAINQPWLRALFGVTQPIDLWWGILPVSAGVFGVPLGFVVIVIVSLVTPAPNKPTQELIEHLRYPNLKGTRSA
jgi:cation/acetate symporter